LRRSKNPPGISGIWIPGIWDLDIWDLDALDPEILDPDNWGPQISFSGDTGRCRKSPSRLAKRLGRSVSGSFEV
jgi:hypothetical protein